MPYSEALSFLRERLRPFGLDPAPFWTRLVALAEALEEHAEELHLTAVRGVEERLRGPFLDSLFLAAHLPRLSPAADLGTGAGIPGLVVKIARPELEIHLLEAYAPRVAFMEAFIERHGLSGAWPRVCHVGREDCGVKAPLVFARGYGEVGKFVRHARDFLGAREAYYLWRKGVEPWRPGALPLELTFRRALPDRDVELLVWKQP